MNPLDLKLLRDAKRIWAQVIAISLVVAGGVATVVLAIGSHHSLDETRIAYYERYSFADVFAEVRRAPNSLIERIAQINGVAIVEGRIVQPAMLDIPNFSEPASAKVISLPDERLPLLNRLFLKSGRLPEVGDEHAVVVGDDFASAHGFRVGSHFSATLKGRRRDLEIVGTALSPEFIFTVGPGDIMPDSKRFGVMWMSERAMAGAFDLKDSFSSVSLKLVAGASEKEIIRQLDLLLAPYGGRAAYGRKDHASHAWIDHELDMLSNMSRTLPPIFLMVAAFLVNLTLGRLIALEREQIGLFKALGYSNATIASHYLKLVVAISLVGIAIGALVGSWLGASVTRLFGEFFRFPFLVFTKDASVYVLGAVLCLAAALLGSMRAVLEVLKLPPAVAMQPPSPPVYRHVLDPSLSLSARVPQPVLMTLRSMLHHPARTVFTLLGMSLATSILVVALFTRDTMNVLIDVTYFLADRQDATISFIDRLSEDALLQISRLPGVLSVEPSREVPILIRNGAIERRVLLLGKPRNAELSRIIDADLRSVALPEGGIAISSMLAHVLSVRPGDSVEIDLLDGRRRTIEVAVAATVEDYFGMRAMIDSSALSRLFRESPSISSAHVSLDMAHADQFYTAVKAIPTVSGVALKQRSLQNFREAIALLITTMASIYAGLAAVIAFGVVYNNARVSLSERARDLANLRVFGFGRGEVLGVLLFELFLLTLLAQPVGWVIGYGLASIMQSRLAGELMRVRLVVENLTYAIASLVVIAAAFLSAMVIRKRVNSLDLVAVLKTRD